MTRSARSPIRPFGVRRVAAFTGTEATAFDARAIEELGVPQLTLMENAGRSAATVLQHLRPKGSVVVLAGSGNNGGDAVVVARTLLAWGRDVTLIPVGSGTPDGRLTHGWPLDVEPADPEAGAAALARAAVVVDGILGTGLRGAPREAHALWIERVNGVTEAFVCALDVPSGVGSDDGTVPGPAVRADLTVAFGGVKLGSLLQPGRDHAGRLVAVEIGFPPVGEGASGQWVITQGWADAVRPRRSASTHKNEVGAITIVAGSPGMAGAAVLSARAALRAGAGLVRVVSDESNRQLILDAVPEAIFVDRSDAEAFGEALSKGRCTLVGPGLGLDDAADAALATALDAGADPVVLDADALTLVARGTPGRLAALAALRPVLVTPHAGEIARIHDTDASEARNDPVRVARSAAAAIGAPVLLKGAPSVVARPEGPVHVSSTGSSDLAVAGMGDALAGAITAFAGQGATLVDAAALGLHWTGRAAMNADRGAGLVPSDVIEGLPDALREAGPGDTDLPFGFVLFDQDRPR